MDLRHITPEFAVSPQITPDDLATLKELGFKSVICNRPDEEVGPELHHQVIADSAAALGLAFAYLPYYPGLLTEDLTAAFSALLPQLPLPIFAYCRSGTRCSHLWAMDEAIKRPLDEIVALAAEAGYDHSPLLPLLQARADQAQ